MFKSTFSKYFSLFSVVLVIGVVLMGAAQAIIFYRFWAQETQAALSETASQVASFSASNAVQTTDGYSLHASVKHYLDGISELADCHLLLSDRSSSNPQALIESRQFAELINRARREYRLVILDSPPVMRVADAVVLSQHSDAVLFAVGWERTPRTVVLEAMRRLPRSMRARMATVMTRVRPGRLDPLGYYEGYAKSTTPDLKRLPAPGA